MIEEVRNSLKVINHVCEVKEVLMLEFFQDRYRFMRDHANWMVSMFEQLNLDKKVELPTDVASKMTQDLDNFIVYCNEALYLQSIDPDVGEALNHYLIITFNFLKNVYPNDNLMRKVVNIQNLLHVRFSLLEMIKAVPILLERIKHLLQFQFEPFNLSKHYLDQLDRQNSGCGAGD